MNHLKTRIGTQAGIGLLIVIFYFTYYLYTGILNPIPALGDSWDYHIPIMHTLLDGRFLAPQDYRLPQWYYPASAEAINALFLVFGIPLTLSNLLASVCLLVVLWLLARSFGLPPDSTLLFAVGVTGLNVFVRWFNAVSIDVWVAVFYLLTLYYLNYKYHSLSIYIKTGITVGMVLGSKYSAGLYLIPLFFIFGRRFFSGFNFWRLLAFLIPVLILGGFWYERNYLATGNPVYPLPVLNLPGQEIYGGTRIWSIAIKYPIDMFNAFFAEYKLWIFTLPLACLYFLINKYRGIIPLSQAAGLFLLGLINFGIYLLHPTSAQPWIMVSSLRYSYPVFIPLILAAFLLFKRWGRLHFLGYITLACIVQTTGLAYYPKLVFFYLPATLIALHFLNRYPSRKVTITPTPHSAK